MAFFSSLIFTGTRVSGQRERQTQSFEAGTIYFPRDYPFTKAYTVDAEARENEERARWERKPPAKRANFEKLGTRSAWRADWTVVLGLEKERPVGVGGMEEFVTTQREEGIEGEEVVEGRKVRPWLLRGADVPNILSTVSKLFNHGAGLLSEINKLRLKRNQDPLDASIKADDLWKGALVSVRVMVCARGAPNDLAVIYAIGDEEVGKWGRVLQKRKGAGVGLLDEESADEVKVSVHVLKIAMSSFVNDLISSYRISSPRKTALSGTLLLGTSPSPEGKASPLVLSRSHSYSSFSSKPRGLSITSSPSTNHL